MEGKITIINNYHGISGLFDMTSNIIKMKSKRKTSPWRKKNTFCILIGYSQTNILPGGRTDKHINRHTGTIWKWFEYGTNVITSIKTVFCSLTIRLKSAFLLTISILFPYHCFERCNMPTAITNYFCITVLIISMFPWNKTVIFQ